VRLIQSKAKALEALDRLPRTEKEILFPNTRGSRIDFRSFGRRHWKPAQRAAGIEPLRDLYDLRHTYATFALRAGAKPQPRPFPLPGATMQPPPPEGAKP
jgi:integrase